MTDEPLTPERAFALLGNETRIGIVRVLGAAEGDPMSFSDLRERVGTRDSGQFNYHLQKLDGSFIRRTEDEQYELSYAGARVVGAIYSGEFTRQGESRTFELSSDCHHCGARLQAHYEDESVRITCPDCDAISTNFGFPPGGLTDRAPDALARIFDSWLTSVFSRVSSGLCNNCSGRMTHQFITESPHVDGSKPVYLEYSCVRCPDSSILSISTYLYFSPPVEAFYRDHGTDLRSHELWNSTSLIDPDLVVAGTDPWEVHATVEAAGETATFVIDEDLAVARL